ncbi:MAG: ATP-binding protein, partial [Enterobacterales bacterium]|nr:ATP-binding protein [Enterobacterales bacterium]
VDFPARFQLFAAMNPCPCGYFGSKLRACNCASPKIQQYIARVSGPLLDRIDIQIQVNNPTTTILDDDDEQGLDVTAMQTQVACCRQLQQQRQGKLNMQLSSVDILALKPLKENAQASLKYAIKQWGLSMRAQERILRLALTISDLSEAKDINQEAIAEALSYRAYEKLQKQLDAWL